CLPNEYLYYYYYTRDALATIRASATTRGEFLLRQQADFYDTVTSHPDSALQEWNRVRRERNTTYMAADRETAHAGQRAEEDIESGGYEGVALALMSAICRGLPTTLPLNVRNGRTVPGLPSEAIIEVTCTVNGDGAHPLDSTPLSGAQLGLVQQIKAVEQLTIEAACTHSASTALAAFALHPLVDSVSVARALLDNYRARIPDIAAVLR
ncbi:MAG: 6-phospho-beta-glucosidase, partial [Candidatus Dormibacteraceae bacterium]